MQSKSDGTSKSEKLAKKAGNLNAKSVNRADKSADKIAKVAKKGMKGSGSGQGVVDERFAAAQTDPRFHRFPKAKNKVEIDQRFAGEKTLTLTFDPRPSANC